MQNLVDKFSKPGEIVPNPFSGMYTTAKACLELLRLHRYIRCNVDAKCFAESRHALAEMYARQVLKTKLNNLGIYDVVDARKKVIPAL